MRNAVIYCYHSLPANGTISKRQMFNSQTKFKKVSSKILLSVLSTHVLYVSVEGWEENTQRAKLIKYSTRCWTDDWQRTCFCLLSVLETYLSCSAIVIVRFYKQIPFWAICSIIFFLWTASFRVVSVNGSEIRQKQMFSTSMTWLPHISAAAERLQL